MESETTPRSIPPDVRSQLADFGVDMPEDRRHRYYDNAWWRDSTVLDDFSQACKRNGKKTAIVTYRSSGDVHRLDYHSLASHVDRIGGALIHMGVGKGDVVSIQLPNWWQFAAIALASLRIGAIVNPIIPIHRAREVRFIAELLESKVVFTARRFRGFDHAAMLRELAPALPHLQERVIVDAGELPRDLGLSFEEDVLGDEWELRYRSELDSCRVHPDQVADVQFTSGTTGEPKGVVHTHNTQFARARALYEPLHLDESDVVFMPSTLAHSTGFVYGFVAAVMRGMTAVYQDVWEPEKALAIIEGEGVTWSFGSTAFVTDLIKAQRAVTRDLSHFKYFVSGGAAIPPAVVQEASDILSTRLIACWGMTENGGVTFTPIDAPQLAAAHSDGKPAPWMEVKVVDPDTGDELAAGVAGKLKVRGASQMLGYAKRPHLTSLAVDEEQWFDTGDLAYRDAEGNVRITGRAKDIIVRGGENVPVVEIEVILYRHPDIDEVAIVGYPDDRLGERACAVVIPAPGATPTLEDITSYLEDEGVSKTYWPERLEIVTELPRTLSGKIQKFRLKEKFSSLENGGGRHERED